MKINCHSSCIAVGNNSLALSSRCSHPDILVHWLFEPRLLWRSLTCTDVRSLALTPARSLWRPLARLLWRPLAHLLWRPLAHLLWRPLAHLLWRPLAHLLWRQLARMLWSPLAHLLWRPLAHLLWRPLAHLLWRPLAHLLWRPLARSLWRPLACSDARSLALTPARSLWRPLAHSDARSFTLTPARSLWRPLARPDARSLALTPARLLWRPLAHSDARSLDVFSVHEHRAIHISMYLEMPLGWDCLILVTKNAELTSLNVNDLRSCKRALYCIWQILVFMMWCLNTSKLEMKTRHQFLRQESIASCIKMSRMKNSLKNYWFMVAVCSMLYAITCFEIDMKNVFSFFLLIHRYLIGMMGKQ